jgi:hypothetical protein
MLARIGWFSLIGFIWLFLFSIPIDKNNRVFDVGFNLIVDSVPVNWAVSTVQEYIDSTKGAKNPAAGGTFAKGLMGKSSSF